MATARPPLSICETAEGISHPSIWISVRAMGMPVAATLDVCPTCKCMKSSVSTFDRLLPGLRNMPTSPSGRRWQRLAHLSSNSLSCACERERRAKQPSCSARMRHEGSQRTLPGCRSCCAKTLPSVANRIPRGATHAFVHACALRSCRGDRDNCVLCSVPSRSLSVARPNN